MPTSLIIGSGPAAAGVALALVGDPQQRVIVVDVGVQLEDEQEQLRAAIAATPEETWAADIVEAISGQPVSDRSSVLPEKRAYGSDFPFRDVGQLEGIQSVGGANRSVVSGAYGGYSNVWGAQIMPFSAATFDRWPIGSEEMAPHYRVALDEMTLTAATDDLATLFPLIAAPRSLPELAERTQAVLGRYELNRAQVQSHGITLGRARLAMRSEGCTLTGLCMTGCPYGVIYSASQTFDRLRTSGRVAYRSDLLAVRLGERDAVPQVEVRNIVSGRLETLTADRVYVACGGIGTTRLVLGSVEHFDRPIDIAESAQFVMPAMSARATRDPRDERHFTLNQFNLVYDASGDGYDLCQVHFYPYNPAFLSALPSFLRRDLAAPVLSALLRRLSVGLGYLPSWASPTVRLTARRRSAAELPGLVIDREPMPRWPPMLRKMTRSLMRVAPALDLWPVLPKTSVAAAAKSYHFGGSFPHRDQRSDLGTDRLGRLDRWDNIHLVDASVFPSVPATTFTLTVMANAHRIASESLSRRP